MRKNILSYLLLVGFIAGIGLAAFQPDLALFRDTEWDPAGFGARWGVRLFALLGAAVASLGLAGWTSISGRFLFAALPREERAFPSFAASTALFSFAAFGLAVNGILWGPLVLLFFLPALLEGWASVRKASLSPGDWRSWDLLILLPVVLWLVEYLSPPLAWDAVLDHFRFAREVARTHQLPLRWSDHTGDVPKFAGLMLAAFYSMGGEALARMGSALAMALTVLTFRFVFRSTPGAARTALPVLLSCGFFLFIQTFGYVEGFLAAYELAALACLFEALRAGKERTLWFNSSAFLLGCALGTKYTALFAAAGLFLVWVVMRPKTGGPRPSLAAAAWFLLPCLPWLMRNFLSHGNPFYPVLTGLFGSAPDGYTPGMEKMLWSDTGAPASLTLPGILATFWNGFFTMNNQVGAAFTPLVLMALPWAGKAWKDAKGKGLILYAVGSLACWAVFATSLRHAAGGALALVAFAGLAWSIAFAERGRHARVAFVCGWAVSLWLAFAAQLRTDAPYAAALGLEGRDARLARHYYFDRDAFAAYRAIEKDMRPGDRVLAHGVFQTYPLRATTYVDFKWKNPNLIRWEIESRTAERLASKLRQKGIRYILFQREEARRMLRVAPFTDNNMGPDYERFWGRWVEPLRIYENTIVYRVLDKPARVVKPLPDIPSDFRIENFIAKCIADKNMNAVMTELGGDWTRSTGYLWFLRSQAEYGLGNYRGAKSAVKKSRSLGLDNAQMAGILADCLEKSGKAKEARIERERAARMAESLHEEIRMAMDDR